MLVPLRKSGETDPKGVLASADRILVRSFYHIEQLVEQRPFRVFAFLLHF